MNWESLWGIHMLLANDITQDNPYEEADLGLLFRSSALTIADLRTRGGVRLEVPHTSAHVFVCTPIDCEFLSVINGFELVSTSLNPLIISPGMQMSLRFQENIGLRILRIDCSTVTGTLEATLVRTPVTPIRFETSFDLSAPKALRWIYATQLLGVELDQDDALLHTTLGATSLAHLLVSALLSLVPSNYSKELQELGTETSTMRRALAFIDENLALPIMVEDVANAAMVSVRTLQQTFKENTGTTISNYVRACRLDRIHQELTEPQPGVPLNISKLGARWGIPHAGRLSRWYKERFGVAPSQTIAQREETHA